VKGDIATEDTEVTEKDSLNETAMGVPGGFYLCALCGSKMF
jgi:hypothetical protein